MGVVGNKSVLIVEIWWCVRVLVLTEKPFGTIAFWEKLKFVLPIV